MKDMGAWHNCARFIVRFEHLMAFPNRQDAPDGWLLSVSRQQALDNTWWAIIHRGIESANQSWLEFRPYLGLHRDQDHSHDTPPPYRRRGPCYKVVSARVKRGVSACVARRRA